MLLTVIEKELKAILLSPKFGVTFGVCSVLILLSVFVGIRDYESAVATHEAALGLTQRTTIEQTWSNFSTRAYRTPDPMQIFVTGVDHDIGRFSNVARQLAIKLRQSVYSDETIYALFRALDICFITQVVLSLIAILFTYDAVNGEREGGTLRLTFAHAVPRGTFILGKALGSWLGLVVPLLIPTSIALLLVLLYRVPMTSRHWQELLALVFVSLLFFTFFVFFGVLMSTLSRRSSVSFLISLVAWVGMVLIVPRFGAMLAGQIAPVPSVGEMESLRAGFEKDRWSEHEKQMQSRWQERMPQMHTLEEGERDKQMQEWSEADRKLRQVVQEEITQYATRLAEERRAQLAQQEKLALTLSRFSPASAYQLAAMHLAGTDIHLKARAEDDFQAFRTRALEEAAEQAKKKENQNARRGIMIRVDSGDDKEGEAGEQKPHGFNISFAGNADRPTLDPAQIPVYVPQQRSLGEVIAPTFVDAGLLAIYSIVAFAAAFIAFLRYDVR